MRNPANKKVKIFVNKTFPHTHTQLHQTNKNKYRDFNQEKKFSKESSFDQFFDDQIKTKMCGKTTNKLWKTLSYTHTPVWGKAK